MSALEPPAGVPFPFRAEIDPDGRADLARTLRLVGPGADARPLERRYSLADTGQPAYLDLFAAVADDFGLRPPVSRQAIEGDAGASDLTPILTTALSPDILYGYGDPAVLRVTEGDDHVWWLTVTSNDAPDAFPLLRSSDCRTWTHEGFVFPDGRTPAWALTGPNQADFWAPEMHRVGDEYWVCFTAREADRSLAVGLAKADHPGGPYVAGDAPLVRGGVIDSHILLDAQGAPWLFWKRDDNGVWPRALSALLHRRPDLITALFPEEADQRTASLAATLEPFVRTVEPMEQFALLQPLIEAATHDFAGFAARLRAISDADLAAEIGTIAHALKTRVYGQPLAADGSRLLGEPTLVLENDQLWEAHLIEGVWITEQGGRYYLLYAGNDFSTPHYGIGAAVADHPLGPYVKMSEPLLRSSLDWSGPGHPSVAIGPDGEHRMFLHAFAPGVAGYKAFRALLSTAVTYDSAGVRVG